MLVNFAEIFVLLRIIELSSSDNNWAEREI
jgi:hypothetical protein